MSDTKRVRISTGVPYGDLYAPDIFGTKPDAIAVMRWKIEELQAKIRVGAQRPAKLQSSIDYLAGEMLFMLVRPDLSKVTIERVNTLAHAELLERRKAARNSGGLTR